MTIDLRVDNDALSVASPAVIVSGSKNYYKVSAVFTNDWEGLSRTLVISANGGSAYSVSMSQEADGCFTAVLPEYLVSSEGYISFGILGHNGSELRISTNIVRMKVLRGVSEGETTPPSPDESSTWEGYIGNIAKTELEKITSATDNTFYKKFGAATWTVDNGDWNEVTIEWPSEDGTVGSQIYQELKDCEKDEFIGTWFRVAQQSGQGGSVAYNTSKYDIYGADGYLNCGDYVIWLGRWVRFNVYEAKASTVKNADGKYSPKSGVCGLMSSTQAAYLTDLINSYWGYDRVDLASREEHYANNCVHGGLYSPITSGRSADIDDSGGVKETLGLLVIPDNLNNRLVQVGFSQKRKGYVWTRICTDKNAKLFDDWVRIAPTNTEVALEEIAQRVSALEQQLNGISFGVNENGNLTYEKEVQNENNS